MDTHRTYCPPRKYSLYAEISMRRMTVRGKFTINGGPPSNIKYADDTVIISDDKEDLKSLLTVLEEESGRRVLSINKKKTKIMFFSSEKANNPGCHLSIKNEPEEQVQKLEYLGICQVMADVIQKF